MLCDDLRRLKELSGKSQDEIAAESGISKSTLAKIMAGVTKQPSIEAVKSIVYAMGFRLQDLDDKDPHNQITSREYDIIKKYRFLDHNGQATVLRMLEHEVDRVQDLRSAEKRIAELESKTEKKCYPFLHHLASAGTAFAFDEVPTDTIDAPFMPGADFVIGVNGDCMEPTLHDGDLLYVKKTDRIKNGTIGIFTLGNEWYVKERGEHELISHNPEYNNIPGTSDIRLVGVVLGKVPEY